MCQHRRTLRGHSVLIHLLVYLFIDSTIQHMFIEYIICARLGSRYWGIDRGAEQTKLPVLMELTF